MSAAAAGGALCQYDSSDLSCQSGEGGGVGGEGGRGEAGLMHERLVAYVHALTHGSRRGVWGEHSYARSRIGGAARAGRVRALLAPRALSPPPAEVDVVGLGELPPEPPGAGDPAPSAPAPFDDEDAPEDEWEARVASLAPSAAHARLAAAAGDVLRALTLERLAGVGTAGAGGEERREQARAAARRLRRALALAAGAGRPPAPAWLHGALLAVLPRATRRLYEEAVGELRGSAPRLAERLTGAWASPPAAPLPATSAVGPEAAPWLVWVASGRGSLDARWEQRLAALLHTRVLRPLAPESAPPAVWCAAAAARVRDQLTDALADAGERSVILGGVGAGAALAGTLARGAGGVGGGAGGVRGCALLAPPLLSAEGAAAAEALAGVRLPLLVVCGGGAGGGGARALAGRGRRLLEVRGADGELRVPRALRRRLRLPQGALDAAVAEELARWALDAAERGEEPPHEEYAHLPSAGAGDHPPPLQPTSCRSIEVVEGRVVSRCAGGTPLTLAPPRPRDLPPSPASAPLHAADIMQLPVVFADDTGTGTTGTTGADSSGVGGSPVTVTSGGARGGGGGGASAPGAPAAAVKLTRVILASRGAGAGAGESGGLRGRGRVLLRRPLRVLAPPGKEPARPSPSAPTSSEHGLDIL